MQRFHSKKNKKNEPYKAECIKFSSFCHVFTCINLRDALYYNSKSIDEYTKGIFIWTLSYKVNISYTYYKLFLSMCLGLEVYSGGYSLKGLL